MSGLLDKIKSLKYHSSELSKDIKIADWIEQPFELKVLFYKRGTLVPPHKHTTETVHIVLSGEMEVLSKKGEGTGKRYPGGHDYMCGGWEYRARALKDTYVLLCQTKGTKFIKT